MRRIIILLLVFISINSFSQDISKEEKSNQNGYWNFNIGVTVPTGEYMNEYEQVTNPEWNLGGTTMHIGTHSPKTGIIMGGGYTYRLSKYNLDLYSNLSLTYSATETERSKEQNDKLKSKFINIPISVGLKYIIKIKSVELLPSIGIVNNTFIITKENPIDITNYYSTSEFSTSNSFGWEIGIGGIYKNKYTLNINYTKTTPHKIEYYNVVDCVSTSWGRCESGESNYSIEKTINYISFSIGYIL